MEYPAVVPTVPFVPAWFEKLRHLIKECKRKLIQGKDKNILVM
jgi:hypothetical protein